MLNKITQSIKSKKNLFSQMRRLGTVNYLDLLSYADESWFNQAVVDAYNKCNRIYGNCVNIDDDDTNKNNIWKVADLLKEEMLQIEPDERKIIYSLVYDLYSKPSERKKNLLWLMYGEQMYSNLQFKVGKRTICKRCGGTNEELVHEGMCTSCLHDQGKKIAYCIDCGTMFLATRGHGKTHRCKECQAAETRRQKREYFRKRQIAKKLEI